MELVFGKRIRRSADLAPLISISSFFAPWISGVPDLEVGKALAMWGVKPFDVNVDRFTANHFSQIHEDYRFRYLGFGQMTPDDLFSIPKWVVCFNQTGVSRLQ